jgi:pimeloyl-ACP methyl ester carboxylesterase
MPEFVLDMRVLADNLDRDPITIIAHSLGGAISLQYAGVYPDRVKRVVSIEGLGPPAFQRRLAHVRMQTWLADMLELERRRPRRYPTIDAATKRMEEENPHLSPEMARHLTIHGLRQNEDNTYSWKFDNFVRSHSPYDFNLDDAREIWNQITCPVLLFRGEESWAADPVEDGRASAFHNARIVTIKDAGHWVHHDQLDQFLEITKDFLLSPD